MKIFDLNNERANRLTKEILRKELQGFSKDINNATLDVINVSNSNNAESLDYYNVIYLENLIELNIYNKDIVEKDLKLSKKSKIIKAINFIHTNKEVDGLKTITMISKSDLYEIGILADIEYYEDLYRSYINKKYSIISHKKLIKYFENNLGILWNYME